MAVHTEHFKCENHLPGVERTMTACFDVMQPQVCDGSANLLGQRLGDFQETELCGVCLLYTSDVYKRQPDAPCASGRQHPAPHSADGAGNFRTQFCRPARRQALCPSLFYYPCRLWRKAEGVIPIMPLNTVAK